MGISFICLLFQLIYHPIVQAVGNIITLNCFENALTENMVFYALLWSSRCSWIPKLEPSGPISMDNESCKTTTFEAPPVSYDRHLYIL